MKAKKPVPKQREGIVPRYDGLMGEIAAILERSRRSAARAVNNVLAATYWDVGRRIVEFEQ